MKNLEKTPDKLENFKNQLNSELKNNLNKLRDNRDLYKQFCGAIQTMSFMRARDY